LNAGEQVIALRHANLGDLDMVFRWRNDPFILAYGSLRREVAREEHQKWFAETVSGKTRQMFIILERQVAGADKAIGQIRFERESGRECVVSVYLLQEFTGRGYGAQAIRMGCAAIFQTWDVDRVVACVRFDNQAGRSAFLKAGFNKTEALPCCPGEHHSMIFSRESRLG
jgi:RimJ/RimL family protein N-acetyltransferase